MWLLDANMDVHLIGVLEELGIACETAAHRGWRHPGCGVIGEETQAFRKRPLDE